MAKSRDVVVFLKGDDKHLKKTVANGIKGIKKFGASVASMTRKAGLALTAFGALATGVLIKSVSAFNEQARVEAQLNSVLKATGNAAGFSADELKKYAKSLSEVTKFSDEAIIGGQALLLSFTEITGNELKTATEVMLDLSEFMGQDLKSSAIQLGKSLNDPAKGLSALSEVGVTFSVEQSEVIKKLAETGEVAKAQAMMMKILTGQMGHQARDAAKTFGGQVIILKNQFINLLEVIGGLVIPTLQALVTWIRPIISGWIEWIKNQKDLKEQIKDFVLNTVTILVSKLKEIWEVIKPLVMNLKEWAAANPELTAKIAAFAGAVALLSPILGPLLIALPTMIGLFKGLLLPFKLITGSIQLLMGIGGLAGGGLIGLGIALTAIAGAAGVGWALGRWIDKMSANTAFGKWVDGVADKLVGLINGLKEFLGLQDKALDPEAEEIQRNKSRAEFKKENEEFLKGLPPRKYPPQGAQNLLGNSGTPSASGSSDRNNPITNTITVVVQKMEDAGITIDSMTSKLSSNLGKQGKVVVT